MACYLASQDNPEAGLCRNEPITGTDGLSQDGAWLPRTASSHDLDRNSGKSSQKDPGGNDGQSSIGTDDVCGDQPHSEELPERSDPPPARGIAKDAKRLKDPKSFTQNLFDTLSMRMVEWLPLKRQQDGNESRSWQVEDGTTAASKLHRDKSHRAEKKDHESVPDKLSESERTVEQSRVDKPKPSRVSPTPTNTAATALELKIPGTPTKRLSLGELESWKSPLRPVGEEKSKHDRKSTRNIAVNDTPTTTAPRDPPPSPPTIKNRTRKHRQKRRCSDIRTSYETREKQSRRVSWDSSSGLREGKHVDEDREATQTDVPRQPASPPATAETELPDLASRQTNLPRIQSLSCLSKEIIDGLERLMFETRKEWEAWKDEMQELESRGYSEAMRWQHATSRQRQLFPFVEQSIYYVFSSPSQLLESFHCRLGVACSQEASATPVSLDTSHLEESFRQLYRICSLDTALHSLWTSLEKFFVLPREFCASGKHQRRSIRCSTPSDPGSTPRLSPRGDSGPIDEYFSDSDTAHVIVIVLFALASSIPPVDSHAWQTIRHIRSSGTVLPDHEIRKHSKLTARLSVDVTDKFEHSLALRLVHRLARVVAARLAFHEMSKTRSSAIQDLAAYDRDANVVDLIIRCMQSCIPMSVKSLSTPFESSFFERPTTMPMVTVEWLRTLLLREWDGNPVLATSSAAGGALQLLASMYRERAKLALQPEDFHTPFLSERLDPMDMPVEWLGILPNNRSMHLLSYSFMFPPSVLIIYFRAMNYSVMSKSYETAMTSSRHVTQNAFSNTIPIEDDVGLLARLKTSISTYLVLTIRRDNVLMDALNQLWRREKRQLMRPLKVQMGMDEGEEGVDHGGVQQEFFRVAMAEAMDPSFGMFTLVDRTGMSWFQPCSLEPLYKYELLGLLMSLAVYNGLTVPVNFPVAMYRKLLGLKVKKLDHISEGWPDLAKGLGDLLAWKDGDVSDIFVRTYEFGFEAFGEMVTVDMDRIGRDEPWPTPERSSAWDQAQRRLSKQAELKGKDREDDSQDSNTSSFQRTPLGYQKSSNRDTHPNGILKAPASRRRTASLPQTRQEAPLVTNANREQFVKDYIFWLTDKSTRPQYDAFCHGFYTCLDRTALSIFTPESLKTVVEGIQEIDIGELQRHARYEGGFDQIHRVIKDFWYIVGRYSQEKKSQLLEFVTACDRVPVSGITSIMFVIQKNGVGDDVSEPVFFSNTTAADNNGPTDMTLTAHSNKPNMLRSTFASRVLFP